MFLQIHYIIPNQVVCIAAISLGKVLPLKGLGVSLGFSRRASSTLQGLCSSVNAVSVCVCIYVYIFLFFIFIFYFMYSFI